MNMKFKTACCHCLLLTATFCASAFAQTPNLTVCAGKGFRLTSSQDASGITPITYAWYENGENMGGAYNTASISIAGGKAEAGVYHYVRVASNSACTLSSNTCTVAVLAQAGNGQAANSCGCVTGAVNCGGVCQPNNDYTTNDGACTGQCNLAYVQLRDGCTGAVKNSRYGTYTNTQCKDNCGAVQDPSANVWTWRCCQVASNCGNT